MSWFLFVLYFLLGYFTTSNAQNPCEIQEASSANTQGTIQITYKLTGGCGNEAFGLQVLCDRNFIPDSLSSFNPIPVPPPVGSGLIPPYFGSGGGGAGSGFRPGFGSGSGRGPGSGAGPIHIDPEIEYMLNANSLQGNFFLPNPVPAGIKYYCRLNANVDKRYLTKAIDPITTVSGTPSTPVILSGAGSTNGVQTNLEVTLRCEHTGVTSGQDGDFAFQILVMDRSSTSNQYRHNKTHPMPNYIKNTIATVKFPISGGGDALTVFAAAKNKYGESNDIGSIPITLVKLPNPTTTTTQTMTTTATPMTNVTVQDSDAAPIGAIVGGVIGGLIFLFILIAVVILVVIFVVVYVGKSSKDRRGDYENPPTKDVDNTAL